MTNNELHEILLDYFGDENELDNIVTFENPAYTNAIIGISDDNRLIYSFDKMIECLISEDNMSEEEAIEFIEYNTVRSLPYASSLTNSTQTPIIMRTIIGLN